MGNMLTNKQTKIAIAEACGWRVERLWIGEPHGKPIGEQGPFRELPDYCNDLNAMHEAECWLADRYPATYELYCREVAKVAHYPITIAAIVRAKLFVKTLGKWEEEV